MGFFLTNRVANSVLRPLLRGPLGRRLGRRLAVLRYRGRRTGTTRELVVQFARMNDLVWVVPGQPERKRWWRNMLDPHPVEVWLEGTRYDGVATVVDHTNPLAMAKGANAYRTAFPRVKTPAVMVCIELTRAPR